MLFTSTLDKKRFYCETTSKQTHLTFLVYQNKFQKHDEKDPLNTKKTISVIIDRFWRKVVLMKRKYEDISPSSSESILFCGHSSWKFSYETTIIPENTKLYVYAPTGSALSQQVVRAIAAGETIQKGDLQFCRISPLTLFNMGYEDKDGGVGQYEPKILSDYPRCLNPGEKIKNYRMESPGKASLQSRHDSIVVVNIDEPNGVFLGELLQKNKGTTCHFGGCSWVDTAFDKRNIVDFANPVLAQKYKDSDLSEEEKRRLRKKRFMGLT